MPRIVFLGTPAFAVSSLEAVHDAGFELQAVYTQPDRPKGRGHELALPPVKEAALKLGLTVRQPERVRRPEVVDELRALAPDCMVVVGYGQIIPQSIIDIPPMGILNVHASLLPKYRGAAPIQWAIANGETETGVTIMRIDAGLDTGNMIEMEPAAIGERETAPELSARLAGIGARLLVNVLRKGDTAGVPQDHAVATLAPILKKEDGLIDFSRTAHAIDCRLRGFTPWPGAYTMFRGETLKVLKTIPAGEGGGGAPGSIHLERKRLFANCGGATRVELIEVQLEGRKRLSADAFINGHHPLENEILGG